LFSILKLSCAQRIFDHPVHATCYYRGKKNSDLLTNIIMLLKLIVLEAWDLQHVKGDKNAYKIQNLGQET
jgi:hypothetical protein